jgi:hypothetical protein
MLIFNTTIVSSDLNRDLNQNQKSWWIDWFFFFFFFFFFFIDWFLFNFYFQLIFRTLGSPNNGFVIKPTLLTRQNKMVQQTSQPDPFKTNLIYDNWKRTTRLLLGGSHLLDHTHKELGSTKNCSTYSLWILERKETQQDPYPDIWIKSFY